MAIAGLWEAFSGPGGEIVRTYCILTIEAAGEVAKIHDRMPLVLEERDWPLWLGEVPGDPATLLQPPADDLLAIKPMSRETTEKADRRGKQRQRVYPLFNDDQPGSDPEHVRRQGRQHRQHAGATWRLS